jgi:DNA-directed RNA polymerase specialized sigma24 family protein
MEPEGGAVGVPGVDQLTARAPEDLTRSPEGPLADGPALIGFADFYRQSRTGLVRALAVTIGDRDLAVEAVDEALARAYQRWPRVGQLESPGGWAFRVALNWATSVQRRRRRAPQPLGERDPSDIGPIGEPDVLVALAELDVRQRAVVVCRHLLGWSEAETADALGIPAGTVKSRLHRATQHLATRLDHLRPDHLGGPRTEDNR